MFPEAQILGCMYGFVVYFYDSFCDEFYKGLFIDGLEILFTFIKCIDMKY